MRETNPLISNKQKLTDLKQQSSKKLPQLQKLSLGELDGMFGGYQASHLIYLNKCMGAGCTLER